MYKSVNGRWGTCKFLSSDEYVGRSMFYYGEYGPEETEMVLSLAKGLCLDIGANIGCISQALVTSGFSVVAFEPQPVLFALLEENVDCVAHNVALGSVAGLATMPKVHYSAKGNFGGLGVGESSIYGNITVGMNTLDAYNFSGVGFIKLDVEGYELEVLRGGLGTICRDRPVLYIEDDRVGKSYALRAFIRSLGYKITEHKPALYRSDNYFGLKRNVWNQNYVSHNLICTYDHS